MVEHRIIQPKEAEPAPGKILGEASAELPMRGNFVDGRQEQGPEDHLRVNSRPAETVMVVLIQLSNQCGEVEGGIDLDQKVTRIDAIAQGARRAGIERTVSTSPVNRTQHGQDFLPTRDGMSSLVHYLLPPFSTPRCMPSFGRPQRPVQGCVRPGRGTAYSIRHMCPAYDVSWSDRVRVVTVVALASRVCPWTGQISL